MDHFSTPLSGVAGPTYLLQSSSYLASAPQAVTMSGGEPPLLANRACTCALVHCLLMSSSWLPLLAHVCRSSLFRAGAYESSLTPRPRLPVAIVGRHWRTSTVVLRSVLLLAAVRERFGPTFSHYLIAVAVAFSSPSLMTLTPCVSALALGTRAIILLLPTCDSSFGFSTLVCPVALRYCLWLSRGPPPNFCSLASFFSRSGVSS